MFLIGAGTIVIAASLLAATAAGGASLSPGHLLDLRQALGVACALCGVAVFCLCRARWQQVGEGAAVWAGGATLVLGLAVGARPEVAGALLGGRGPDAPFLTALCDSGFVLGPLLFAAGLLPSLERRPVSPLLLVALSTPVVVALALLFRALPDLGAGLNLSRSSTRAATGGTTLAAVTVAAWIALAVGYALRGLRRNWLYTWGGLTLFAMALAGLASRLSDAEVDAWAGGAPALEALGLVLALVACSAELARAYQRQAHRLFDSQLDAETAEVRERLRMASMRSRRHDLANAVTAIEGAAMILEREFDRLTPDDRNTLTRVLESGTARLRGLLAQEGPSANRVSLSEVAVEATSSEPEAAFVVDVPADLVGTGSAGETREALRQLLDFARHRCPAEPLVLRGERDGAWVVLRVEDRGPDLSRQQRLALADGDPHPGSTARLDDSMGLRVAARLMRRQGGDLWVGSRAGGGATFGICLPAVQALTSAETGDDVGGAGG